MKIGIISDIHGNCDALEVILHEFEENNVEKIICLGDMIGYFHQSIEVLDRLMEIDISAICGNHEAYLLGTLSYPPERACIYNLEYVQNSISPKVLHWLASLPTKLNLTLDGKKFLFFHGSPWDPLQEYVYPDYQYFKNFLMINSDYFFLGHTHYPFYKKIEAKNIVNPGSVGLPRNGDNRAQAAIFDTRSGIEFVQEEYDIRMFLDSAKKKGVNSVTIQRLKRQ
ncbi:MAG: metallophosphoesterase family protein [Methanoregula sp.]|nr:metallophosphoesterase family protein [Methanoregula sp.]